MNWMTRTVRRLRSCDGQTMTEYALILATIAAVVISLYTTSGTIVANLLASIDGSL
jgi:Flp pilus assembly pilin Flp